MVVIIQCKNCFNGVATISVIRNDYRIHFWYISKDEAVNLLRNADRLKKVGNHEI